MKTRQIKNRLISRMMAAASLMAVPKPEPRLIASYPRIEVVPKTEHEYTINMDMKSLPKVRVVRKKDNVFVDEFDSVAEANAVIARAKAQKKATLVIATLQPVPA